MHSQGYIHNIHNTVYCFFVFHPDPQVYSKMHDLHGQQCELHHKHCLGNGPPLERAKRLLEFTQREHFDPESLRTEIVDGSRQPDGPGEGQGLDLGAEDGELLREKGQGFDAGINGLTWFLGYI